MNTHRDVCIVLKKSLKWIPLIGWVTHYLLPNVFSGLWV
jgi:1-acyl-sn-glycerol-3-phosphate acyltransferase